MKLTFKIRLLSDYHIGAGHGKGIVDSVLLKDKQGLPVIRGTTLGGLLRQGMWDLLQLKLLEPHRECQRSGSASSNIAYCSEENKRSMCPLCRILGTPAYPKKWQISSAEIEDTMMLKPEMVAWRNRVNPKTRRAEARKLFNEEMVGKGVNFLFSVRNDTDEVRILKEAAFIVAAFRMVRNLGASRRRGKGRCQVHLVHATDAPWDLEMDPEDYFLEVFKTVWLEHKELSISNAVSQPGTIKESVPTKKSFTIILLTEEPLLIANKSESGNMYYTNRCIPGYTFLGALAWKAANSCNLNDKDVYEQFIKLFRSRGGAVTISPLYPALKIVDDIYPSIPSPQDFLSCKHYPEFEDFGHGVKGYATDTEEPGKCEVCLKEGIETPLEPMNKYIAVRKSKDEHLEAVEVPVREEMHIAIDPKTGRTKTGALFGYESIDSGAYFVGTIEIADWANFAHFIGIDAENPVFELRIGKASTRGHGKVKVWLRSDMDSKNLFLGTSLEKRVADFTKPLTMTFITDAILVDNWGRFLNKPDKSVLKDLLGVNVEILNTYVKTKTVDGFNAYLGLPKWRDVAIIAGSAVGFKLEHPENEEALLKCIEDLERAGIGLRKEEGFGRIAFNHPIYRKNEGVESAIHIPENMRVKEKMGKVAERFYNDWKKYVNTNLKQELFTNPGWRAVSRWLRTNSGEPIEKIKDVGKFHKLEEPLSDLITQRNALRDKNTFLDEGGGEEAGKKALKDVLEELSNRLQGEDEHIREYLKVKAVEALADFIASTIKEEER
jgi:CRISPR-associated protein Csx10